MRWLACLAVAAVALQPACTWECGDAVYPDVPEPSNVRLATGLTRGETGPPLPFVEATAGSGRFVAWGRRVTVRATFRGSRGALLGSTEAAFLLPAVDVDRLGVGGGVDSGEVPVYFAPVLAGMRVGGVRRFTLPGRPGRDPWRVRGIGQSAPTDIPAEDAVVTDLELLAVCKPKICITSTYSIPAMRERRLSDHGCD